DHLHRAVGLAEGDPAAHRSAYAGRLRRVPHVHVKRYDEPRRPFGGESQALFHHPAHSLLVHLAHGEYIDARLLHHAALARVEIPHADQHALLRLELWRVAENPGQRLRSVSEGGREGHAVHVPAGAGLGRVHVGVGVNPDAAHGLVAVAVKLGDAGDRADRNRVIAAQRHGKEPRLERLVNAVRDFLARLLDFLQVLGALVAKVLLLGELDVNVARVLHLMAQVLDGRVQPRRAYRRRPHVHAAPLLPEVQRHAQNPDFHAATLRVARPTKREPRPQAVYHTPTRN